MAGLEENPGIEVPQSFPGVVEALQNPQRLINITLEASAVELGATNWSVAPAPGDAPLVATQFSAGSRYAILGQRQITEAEPFEADGFVEGSIGGGVALNAIYFRKNTVTEQDIAKMGGIRPRVEQPFWHLTVPTSALFAREVQVVAFNARGEEISQFPPSLPGAERFH